MSDEEFSISVPVPLDSDGFLRRECPTCEREFKWFASESDEHATNPDDAGYHCPYCDVQAEPDHWLTPAQIAHAEAAIAPHAERLVADKLRDSLRGLPGVEISRGSNAPIPEPEGMGAEQSDMRRVDFACHPAEPVKVLDDWEGQVHCLICGEVAASESSS